MQQCRKQKEQFHEHTHTARRFVRIRCICEGHMSSAFNAAAPHHQSGLHSQCITVDKRQLVLNTHVPGGLGLLPPCAASFRHSAPPVG